MSAASAYNKKGYEIAVSTVKHKEDMTVVITGMTLFFTYLSRHCLPLNSQFSMRTSLW